MTLSRRAALASLLILSACGSDSQVNLNVDGPLLTQLPDDRHFESLAAGYSHTCALLEAGEVKCWGNTHKGDVDTHTYVKSRSPQTVPGLEEPVSISNNHISEAICVLVGNGDVHCWALNVGVDDIHAFGPLLPVTGLSGVTHLGNGCVVHDGGAVACWGATDSDAYTAQDLGTSGAVQVAGTVLAGAGIGYAVMDGGDVTRLPDGMTISQLSDIKHMAAGYAHQCALGRDGGVWCWGDNSFGEIGTLYPQAPVVRVDLPGPAVDVACGYNHSCAALADGSVWCWGTNEQGELGDATTETRVGPVQVKDVQGAVTVAAGNNHTCVGMSLGSVACWGLNHAGQLGDGSNDFKPTPVVVKW